MEGSFNETMGCLAIDDFLPGEKRPRLLDLHWDRTRLRVHPFCSSPEEELHGALQASFQACAEKAGKKAIVARGLGCYAALALAEQLSVDKLVLISPGKLKPSLSNLKRAALRSGLSASYLHQIKRLCAFALSNLSLCACEILIINGEHGGVERPWMSSVLGVNSRITRLEILSENENFLFTDHEFTLKSTISCFLQSGELPKSLAENPEMCIIYG